MYLPLPPPPKKKEKRKKKIPSSVREAWGHPSGASHFFGSSIGGTHHAREFCPHQFVRTLTITCLQGALSPQTVPRSWQ